MDKVRVIYHRESDGWWAESPDVQGWTAVADSYSELVSLAEEGVPFALGHPVALKHCPPSGRHQVA